MTHPFARPVAHAATALVLFGACSDDGPTTIAKGENVELVGTDDLAGQTLDIDVQEEDGEVTGQIRFTDDSGEILVTVECADTGTDGLVILGGSVPDDANLGFSHSALLIREGEPDSVAAWVETSESCESLLEEARDGALPDEDAFVDVESGDIETG